MLGRKSRIRGTARAVRTDKELDQIVQLVRDSVTPARTFVFTVPGVPEPMPRPRARAFGRHASVYNPEGRWRGWSHRVFLSCSPPPRLPHDGPVRMKIDYYMPRPDSLPKRFDDGCYCWRKPDQDNMEKLILDALKRRGWFTDDGRVCDMHHRKVYSKQPGVRIEISLLDEGAAP